MTDAAVLETWISRWDHQLLKSNSVPTADYDKARDAYQKLSTASKPETRAAHQEQYLVQKRLLLTKLMELRAAATQDKNAELRAAASAISVTKADSDKVLSDMLSETARHSKKIAALAAKHTDLNMRYDMAGRMVDAVADDEDVDVLLMVKCNVAVLTQPTALNDVQV